MAKKNKSMTLNWEEFKALGNPGDAPEELAEIQEEKAESEFNIRARVRIYLERKGRKGKTASVLKGLDMDTENLENLAREIKRKCGTGGSVKGDEIVIQGDKRKEILSFLKSKGFKDVKPAG